MSTEPQSPHIAEERLSQAVFLLSEILETQTLSKPARADVQEFLSKQAHHKDTNTEPKWHLITPENPPQFPCWLWNPTPDMQHAYHAYCCDDVVSTETHWHPDQPEAPTSVPDGTCPTIGHVGDHNAQTRIMELERELAETRKAWNDREPQLLAAERQTEELRAQLTAWKTRMLAITGCDEPDSAGNYILSLRAKLDAERNKDDAQ